MTGASRGLGRLNPTRFPFNGWSESIQVLIGVTLPCGVRGRDDACEPQQSRLINLVATKKIPVISEVLEKPIEFPKSPLGTVKAAGEALRHEPFWLADDKFECQERLLWMRSIRRGSYAHEEQTVKLVFCG
jgi:hypothetical protein